ncbi:WD40-repeat-containing domain protein [Blastocladiella britannica]|nr:WD40-repeat-containing domain protein [Blastocladiella britannica]
MSSSMASPPVMRTPRSPSPPPTGSAGHLSDLALLEDALRDDDDLGLGSDIIHAAYASGADPFLYGGSGTLYDPDSALLTGRDDLDHDLADFSMVSDPSDGVGGGTGGGRPGMLVADLGDEGLDDAVRKLQQRDLAQRFMKGSGATGGKQGQDPSSSAPADNGDLAKEHRTEVIDDFIRNYLVSMGMLATLEAFENEWYTLLHTLPHPPTSHHPTIPDVYAHVTHLESALTAARRDLLTMRSTVDGLRASLDRATKDRDFFKLHYTRTHQEKLRAAAENKRVARELESARLEAKAAKEKVEGLVKDRTMARIERDRAVTRADALAERQAGVATDGPVRPSSSLRAAGRTASGENGGESGSSNAPAASMIPRPGRKARATVAAVAGGSKPPLPQSETGRRPAGQAGGGDVWGVDSGSVEIRAGGTSAGASTSPFRREGLKPMRIAAVREAGSVRAHEMAVSALAFHPRKLVLASVSDDATWKLWNIPTGELLMTGSGHTDWIADVDFHPRGNHLATASGDMTIKVWDFAKAQATLSLREHTQAAWACRFHESGSTLASGSLDHTCKLWDLNAGKCKQTFRGHADSVNTVAWQPETNIVFTGSGDKTIAAWDARSGHAVWTLSSHTNAVNGIAFSPAGDYFASCDADGIVKLWDVRRVGPSSSTITTTVPTGSGSGTSGPEIFSYDMGPHPANKITVDASGQVVAVASNDGIVRLLQVGPNATLANGTAMQRQVAGHRDAAQACAFDHVNGEYLATASSDGTWKVWH